MTPLQIKPGDEKYERLFLIWEKNGKPRTMQVGQKMYRAQGTEEGTVFTETAAAMENFYGSMST